MRMCHNVWSADTMDSETKRESAEWKSQNSQQAKKSWKVPSKIKATLIVFFDTKAVLLPERDEIGNVIEDVVNLARQINSELDSDSVQEMLDSHNQELIEMHENFSDYVTFDDRLPMGGTEIGDIDVSYTMNSDSDADIDNETPIKTVTFSNVLHWNV
ncbi:hypothetical protein TNCV_301841 [Trichonephila clavipes]|nr:hypothetical protein TNCV_301841 [Trichonephila clavipes]